MQKFLTLVLFLALTPCLRADGATAADDAATAATAIHVEGTVLFETQAGGLQPVQLGQLFEAGDHLVTREDSSLELALADGSTLALGANTEMVVHSVGLGGDGSQNFFEVLKGRLDAIVHKLTAGASFEVGTGNAVAAVKGTQFEVSAETGDSAVTVQEGLVAMSDAQRQHTVMVPALQTAQAQGKTLGRPRALSPREVQAFRQRWAAARAIHAQRRVLLRRLQPLRRRQLARLQVRRQWLRQRVRNFRMHPDRHPAWAAARQRARADQAARRHPVRRRPRRRAAGE